MIGNPTITKVVENGLNKELTHSNFHYKVGFTGKDKVRRVYNWDSIIDKYRDILLQHMQLLELTDIEMVTYQFNPRGFCYDFYMNADMWSVLLRLNNMLTSTDFNKKKFLTFGPSFDKVLKEILMIEDDFIISSRISAKTGE